MDGRTHEEVLGLDADARGDPPDGGPERLRRGRLRRRRSRAA